MWQKLKQPHHLAIAFESKKEGQQPFLPFHTLTCTLIKLRPFESKHSKRCVRLFINRLELVLLSLLVRLSQLVSSPNTLSVLSQPRQFYHKSNKKVVPNTLKACSAQKHCLPSLLTLFSEPAYVPQVFSKGLEQVLLPERNRRNGHWAESAQSIQDKAPQFHSGEPSHGWDKLFQLCGNKTCHAPMRFTLK